VPSQQILALSASSPAELAAGLESPVGQPPAAVGPWRIAIVAADAVTLGERRALAAAALASGEMPRHPEIFVGAPAAPERGGIAWLFPGQGSQAIGMLLALADAWPRYRQHLHRLDAEWSAQHGTSLLAWINTTDTPENRAHLTDTRQAQLALGLVEAALTAAWRDTGLAAEALAGHSYGELPALAAAGAINEETLFALSRQRGLLLGEAGDLAPGGMLAVKIDRDTLQALIAPLADRVFIANDNAPRQVVLAGSHAGIADAGVVLEATGIAFTPLRTACAFHSPLMAPVGDRWRAFLATRHIADIPAARAYSNVSGAAYAGDAAGIATSLAAQLTSPVRWRDEIEAMYAAGCRIFIEVGPGRVLSELCSRILGDRPHLSLASDPGRAPAEPHLARLFAQLWALGVDLDLSAYPAREIAAATVAASPLPAALPSASPAAPTEAGEHPYFSANQQAVTGFFTQQQQLIAALGPQSDPALFHEMVRANQAVMQDFLATQQLALQGAGLPANLPAAPMPAAPMMSAPATPPADNDIETWIIGQLAEMTGLPASRLHRQTQFESELGLDSITLVELWVQLNERFPQLSGKSDQISSVTCIADILRLIDDTTAAPTPQPGGSAAIPAATGKMSIEAWLFNELSMLTGLPADRLNRQTQFEGELGIDSITMVELWIKLVEEFPQYGAHTDGASRVRCVADVLALVGADQAPAPATVAASIAEHPASDWLARLRADIVARIAEERGIDPATITGQSHFAHDLGLDIFTRERIFEEEIGRNPKLAFAGRELLNVANLDELTRLLSRFNNLMSDKPLRIREDGRIVTSDDDAERVERYVLVGQPPVPASELGSLPRRILLIGEEGPNYDIIEDAFTSCGIAIEVLYLGVDCWRHPASGAIVAIDDVPGIAGMLTSIAPEGKLPAVIYLGMSDRTIRGASDNAGAWRDEIERAGVGLFAFAKAASPMIRAMGNEASVGVLTRGPAWAAASGVAKSLTREWPKARIRTVRLIDRFEDLAPRMVLKVLTWGPSVHDIHLVRDGVIRQVLVKKPISQEIVAARRRHPRLNRDSVVLMVGGASGITAEASVMLARHYHAHIVATGRTPMPENYPYQGITDDASLKRMLFDEVNRSDEVNAAEQVRRQHSRIRRQREIWTTRERVLQAGGRFSYYTLDVTDHVALADTLAKIREECGPVHGLIHGAGVIDDCVIDKKSVEEFKAVYYTKAVSVFNLAQSLLHDPLRFVYLFSSLASYTGTPGQTDYVAANEVINAAAKYWNSKVAYPVHSLLWSVWTESGLVASSATQRQMARLGLAGISNEQGIKLLHDELIAAEKFDDWVLLTPQSTLNYTAGGSVHAPRAKDAA